MEIQEINSISADLGDAVLMSNDPNMFQDKIQVHVSGRKYKTLYTRKFLERKKWEAPNPNEVRSIIPGSVTEITVKAGDKVKKGDKLMIYEAMKMKNIQERPRGRARLNSEIFKALMDIGSPWLMVTARPRQMN